MTPTVVAAVLLAAVLHAGWNAMAHALADKLVAFTLVVTGGALAGVVPAVLAPFPAAGAWPYLAVSAVLHLAYQAALMRSFRLGDFGQVYPIARGTAPLVVTVLAALFVGEVPGGWAIAGVALSCAGLVLLALSGLLTPGRGAAGGDGRGAARPSGAAVAAAVATGLAIAAYTTVDGVGVRASGSPLGYVGWLMLVQALPVPVVALAVRGRALGTQLRPVVWRGLFGGMLSLAAYGLVLWAQTRAELAPVAALRESSILVGAAIGTVVFRERFGLPRFAAAGLMVAGIGLMLHTG
ncbi:EamA family transporter [Streptomyces sp. NPDC059740]|uniref:EamA family transporter n=1 Tax=Streptomyces sp. NPDC059740 TaxID=3346926 RepID=UPI003656690E